MSDENKKEVSGIEADNNSIAIGNISAGGNIGNISIQTGYTTEQVSVLITQIQSTFQSKPFDGRCPYKGLDVFEEEDAELFFGREKLVDDLVSRVKDSRTIFITGPSGSGKSSLVRAGLIHALKQGSIKGSNRWLYATMKPGRDPIGELGRMIASLAETTNAEDEIRAKAMGDVTIFARWCEIALKEGRDKRVVLFIDQFEEVFTQISKEEERVAFLNLLTHAAIVENGRVMILFSMRSDFVSNCATYPQLNALLNQQFVQIGAMQPEELVSAIAQPALRVGLRIDPDLIAQIINEMKGEPGALPLMQFALKDLFDSQQEKSGVIALTLNDYLQRGGIHKALERHADDSFAKLSKNEQELARSIFSGLIEIGRGTQDTKRTALFDELVPANTKSEDVEAIVQKLADARLVTTDEQAGKETVTISHEKLIDAWPWLKKLVNENRDVIALQNEISADAKEWIEHHRDNSYLYRGGRLVTAQEKIKKLTLSDNAHDFLNAGVIFRNKEQRERERRLRWTVIASITTAVIFLILGSFGWLKSNEANAQAEIALARQLAAQAHLLNKDRGSNQMVASLLAIQSMRLLPTGEGARFLINDNHSTLPIARIDHDDGVYSTAFSPDSMYVVTGSGDHTARVWAVASGVEISRMTHDDTVSSVAFSPDGRYVASGSSDNTIRVWEAKTGKELSRMTHGDSVTSIAFSPSGKYIVSGSYDTTARVWEAETGKELSRMTHGGTVSSIAFSPDGKYAVSGSYDHTVLVWNVVTGEEIAHMTHGDGVSSVSFSPDGKYVASGSSDYTARVWEAATGDEIARMTYLSAVTSVAFSPDSKYVASGAMDRTANVWKVENGEELARITHDTPMTSIAFSPDGKYVVSGSWDYTARVWEASTGRELAHMTHEGRVYSVAFSPDGKYVVSGSSDKTARVWEAVNRQEFTRMTHKGAVFSIAFSPDGSYMVSGSDDGIARVWKARSREEIARISHSGAVQSVAFSPDGKYVVSGSDDYTIRVWGAVSGEELTHMTHNGEVISVSFSPDGKYVVSGSMDHTARVWSATSGEEVAHMTHGDEVTSVAFSPDSKYVISGSRDNTARVWDAVTGEELARVTHHGIVASVAFSPDGKYVISGGNDGTARVWEAATGEELSRMTHDKVPSALFRRVSSVAFSPDGNYAVSGSWDGTVSIWEVLSGKELFRMTHDYEVNSVNFSPDGKYIVSGSADHTARVWEVASGEEIARMTHDDHVITAIFSPDSSYVVSASWDDTARVWEYFPEDLIVTACSNALRNLTRAEWKTFIGDALPYQAVCPNLPIEPEATSTPTP